MKSVLLAALGLAALLVLVLVIYDILCPHPGEIVEDEHAQAVRPTSPGLPHHRGRK